MPIVDTYVKVTVEQEGIGTIKKQTRIRKNTTHPVFKETFVFCVSPKVELLRSVRSQSVSMVLHLCLYMQIF